MGSKTNLFAKCISKC